MKAKKWNFLLIFFLTWLKSLGGGEFIHSRVTDSEHLMRGKFNFNDTWGETLQRSLHTQKQSKRFMFVLNSSQRVLCLIIPCPVMSREIWIARILEDYSYWTTWWFGITEWAYCLLGFSMCWWMWCLTFLPSATS